MSVDSHLIHTCTIQRAQRVLDEHNQDRRIWSDQRTGLRCRLVIKEQRVPLGELAERPVITTYLLMVPAYTDVRQGDQVVMVVDEAGMTEPGPFRIESVLPRRGRAQRHISLRLERVK